MSISRQVGSSSTLVEVCSGTRTPIRKSKRPPIHDLDRSSTWTWASTSATRAEESGPNVDNARGAALTHRQQATTMPRNGPKIGMNNKKFWRNTKFRIKQNHSLHFHLNQFKKVSQIQNLLKLNKQKCTHSGFGQPEGFQDPKQPEWCSQGHAQPQNE